MFDGDRAWDESHGSYFGEAPQLVTVDTKEGTMTRNNVKRRAVA